MAFESQIGKRRAAQPNRGKAAIRFRKTTSGAGGGTITKAVPLRGMRIDIQLDEATKKIRIGPNENGVSCGKDGTFSCSLHVFLTVGHESIELYDGGDGWWYGSYAAAGKHQEGE